MFRRHRRQPLSPLERLEREANDDFLLLSELGPAEFSAEHLLELRLRAGARLQRFDRLQRLNLLFGVTSLGWIGVGSLAYYSGHTVVGILAFAVATLMLLAFFAGVIYLKIRFESRGELEFTLHSIEEELRRRRVSRQWQ
jgi:hypothetical protein